MEKVDLINSFIKIFSISLLTYYVYNKITNQGKDKLYSKAFIAIISGLLAILYIVLTNTLQPIVAIIVIILIYGVIIGIIKKEGISYCVIVTIISFVITYMVYLISVIISGMLLNLLNNNDNNDDKSIISVLTILGITILSIYSIFKTKRLKNGLNFLKNKNISIKEISIIAVLGGIIILLFSLLQGINNKIINELLLVGTLLVFISIVNWIQSQITKYYKKNMRDRTIEVQKLEIDEHLGNIEEIKEENLKLADVVHRYNNRLSAVEMALEEAINKNMNTEFSNELSIVLEETKQISKSFAKESEILKTKLPLTNISGIDNMFKYMQKEAIENNINFDLKLNDSIHDLIDIIIPKDKFETLLGDHLRDAIIAINFSNNSYRSILVTLGIVENCYELSIYDTGIEFEIETLIKLGKERITTHKDTGGSGIGFMTTFETLKEAKASLVIEEYNPETTSYTKSINIIFDGKSEYRIYSYRAEDIKKQNKDKKIIIKNI